MTTTTTSTAPAAGGPPSRPRCRHSRNRRKKARSWRPIRSSWSNLERNTVFILPTLTPSTYVFFSFHSSRGRVVSSRVFVPPRALVHIAVSPSLAALPVHRLRRTLSTHADHQRLPLLGHDLLLRGQRRRRRRRGTRGRIGQEEGGGVRPLHQILARISIWIQVKMIALMQHFVAFLICYPPH